MCWNFLCQFSVKKQRFKRSELLQYRVSGILVTVIQPENSRRNKHSGMPWIIGGNHSFNQLLGKEKHVFGYWQLINSIMRFEETSSRILFLSVNRLLFSCFLPPTPWLQRLFPLFPLYWYTFKTGMIVPGIHDLQTLTGLWRLGWVCLQVMSWNKVQETEEILRWLILYNGTVLIT